MSGGVFFLYMGVYLFYMFHVSNYLLTYVYELFIDICLYCVLFLKSRFYFICLYFFHTCGYAFCLKCFKKYTS